MHKLILEDQKKFDEAYKNLKIPLGDNNFASIYVLQPHYKDVEWLEINGNLCLFLTCEGQRCVWGPILPGKKLQDTLKKSFEICKKFSIRKNLSKLPSLKYIPEELKKKYARLSGFKVKPQNQDYIYQIKDLTELKGRKYKDKRNKINYFKKKYDFQVQNYSKEEHFEGCKKLLNVWKRQKKTKLKEEFLAKMKAEASANMRALLLSEQLGLKGMVVLVKEKIEGFIFGQRVNKEVCIMLHGKTNLKVKGLSQFTFQEFLKKNFADCKLVNDMEDWDVSYLKSSKIAYNPCMKNKSYMLIEK